MPFLDSVNLKKRKSFSSPLHSFFGLCAKATKNFFVFSSGRLSQTPRAGKLNLPARGAGRLAVCALVVGATFALLGCDITDNTRKDIDKSADEAKQTLSNAEKPTVQKGVDYNPLTVSNKVWGGNAALRMQRGMPLPERFESPRGVTLVSSDPMSLNAIATAIASQTGIPVRLSALSMPGKTVTSSATSTTPSTPSTPAPTSSSASSGFTPAASSAANSPDMPISYEGPLSGLLDRASAYFGVTWHYNGSTISISRYETRVFSIEALPGTQQSSSSFSGSGSSGSGGSSSSGSSGSSSAGGGATASNALDQEGKETIDFKYWDELTAVLNSMLGGQGTVVVSPTMGTVTVTTTGDVMSTVADYLSKENKNMSRQIAINVQIYSVNLGQSEDFDVAFTGFLHNIEKFSGLTYASAAAPTLANTNLASSALGTLGIAILNSPTDPTAHAGDVFNALSTLGDTSTIAQFPMTTLNNHPVSRLVGKQTSYVSTVNSLTTTNTASTTSITPTVSTLQTGFTIQLTPRLLDDGRILLQYALSQNDLQSLQTATYSGAQITLPVINNRVFDQQSMLRSGQTLMIGGVDQQDTAQNKQGVGAPDFYGLGGGTSSNGNHFMMFISITPQVLDVAGGEQN